ncbi:MAG: ZrgA family zinc uptake protein [Bacteriovoracaceae bacterium]
MTLKASIFLVLSSLFTISLMANEYKHHDHHDHSRNLGAHEHGSISLLIAVEENKIDIILEGPLESFTGVESSTTIKGKQKVEDLKKNWSKLVDKIIEIPKQLKCKIIEGKKTKVSIMENHHDGEAHDNISFEALKSCEKSPEKVTIQSHIFKQFKNVHKIKADILPKELPPFTKTYKREDKKLSFDLSI